MKTLSEIAFSALPYGQCINDIVLNTIKRDTSSKLRRLHHEIDRLNGCYTRKYNHYTNILDPTDDYSGKYARTLGYRTLYELLVEDIADFQAAYSTYPVDIDEGNEWFAYLEYMHFRTIPSDSTVWVHVYSKSVILISTARGIVSDITSIPRPTSDCPDDLRPMMDAFDKYHRHLVGLITFFEKRYSHERTFSIQKEYVSVYKSRTESQRPLKALLDFYKNLRHKCARYMYF